MKQIVSIIFSFVLSFFCAFVASAPANATQKEITSILELCETMKESGSWLTDDGSCEGFTYTQTDYILNREIFLDDEFTLGDLNITFKGRTTPINIKSNGNLTINGGHYTSPHCFIWIQYNPETGTYDKITDMNVNAGTFEADLSKENSLYAPSPVCVMDRENMTIKEAKEAIKNYLPEGYHFYDPETGKSFQNLEDADILKGEANIDKDPAELTSTWYLKARIVTVVPDEDEPITDPEEPKEEPKETEPEEEFENPETLDRGIQGYVVIFTMSIVVIFTTLYREKRQNNPYKKHKQ